MTGLRVPPGPASGARPDEDATAGPPAPPAGHPSSFGLVGWARWGWRQLTSMRTALVLLFLLAVGSVPGSLLPQQGIDPAAVQQYYLSHPALAPWLARLSLFNVFAAPWFAAIYLLLFASLAGCVVPRSVRLVRSARALPPPAPRNLARLPQSVRHQSTLDPAAALDAASAVLRRRKFRLRTGDGWVSAEKGYRRELGNLVFHLALLALLGAVALGGLFGYKANRLLVSGTSFANTVTALDQFRPGRLVSPSDLQPFARSAAVVQRVRELLRAAGRRGPPRQPAGQPPGQRGRCARLHHRPRIRAGLQGHRRHRQGGLRPAGPVHRGGHHRPDLRRRGQG